MSQGIEHWLDGASQEAVNLFWQRCGEIEAFPRSLERLVALALPVSIVKLSHLKLSVIENWLVRRGAPFQFNCRSRAIRGCLIAFGGEGLIFVDGTDPTDEQHFTLAHEVAHFITDYLLARRKAIKKFGQSIAEVFDGLRAPSVTQRVHALLASTSIGVYTNLMEREEAGGSFNSGVWEIEDRADRVALALLAPPEDVLADLDISAARFEQRYEVIIVALRERFGLPPTIAAAYGHSLLTTIGRGPSWVETLRLR